MYSVTATGKDITYYANKIAKNSGSKSIDYYADKICTLRNQGSPDNTIYHINEITRIQEKKEESTEAVKRYALFPIVDEASYEFLVKQELTHWTDTELDFISDRKDYEEASPGIKRLLDTILAFFLVGDGAISKNIIFRFLLECDTYEEQAMFISQLHIELVHAMTYGMAAITFKRDPEALAELVETAQNTECIKAKIKFMEKWMLADRPKYQRLVAFCCSEGIFFCTLFNDVFWLRSKGLFTNFVFGNELIASDESLHRDNGSHLFIVEIKKILSWYVFGTEEYTRMYNEIYETVKSIILEAVTIEDMFSEYILPEPLEDLNATDQKQATRLIADNLFVQLGYKSYYNVTSPFTWFNDISMEQKGNFFEVRIASYKKKSVSDIINWKARAGLAVNNSVDVYRSPEDVDF